MDRLKVKYRLVIMNDDTFEEKASWKLTLLNLFVSIGIFLISFTFLLTYVIAFTPLREYIPGYADVNMQRRLRTISETVEDIQTELKANDNYLQNMREIINGKRVETVIPEVRRTNSAKYDSIKSMKALPKSKEDSILRAKVEEEKTAEPETPPAQNN